jgi:hypothetical protein
LRSGKSDVLAVVNNPAAILKLFEYVDRAVSRIVIDYDDLFVHVLLSQRGFKTPFNEPSAVVGHDRD